MQGNSGEFLGEILKLRAARFFSLLWDNTMENMYCRDVIYMNEILQCGGIFENVTTINKAYNTQQNNTESYMFCKHNYVSTVTANNNAKSSSCRKALEVQYETANVTEEFINGICEENQSITGDTKEYMIKRKEFSILNKMSSIIAQNDMASNNAELE